MKVQNMTGRTGRQVANQFIVMDDDGKTKTIYFQSYNSIIVKQVLEYDAGRYWVTYLDSYYWDYSVTTGKYRNIFLNETKKETEQKIESGEYKLINLN